MCVILQITRGEYEIKDRKIEFSPVGYFIKYKKLNFSL